MSEALEGLGPEEALSAAGWHLRNAMLLDPVEGTQTRGDLLLAEGVARSDSDGCAIRELDCSGIWVFPGLFDMHVHLREPGGEASETLESGFRAAMAGGVTALCMMPNTIPPLDSPSMVRDLLDRSGRLGYPGAHVVACLTRGRAGRELADLEELHEAGAIAFSDDGSPLADDDLMVEALERTGSLGTVLVEHPETTEISAGGVVNDGPAARRAGVRGIPARSEVADVERCLGLAKGRRCRLHLTHLSCPESVRMVSSARDDGVDVTCDVTPHHLALSEAAVGAFGTMAKMNPPLRSDADRAGLVELTGMGLVDAVASDHAPHESSSKSGDLGAASFGVTGLETLLPVVLEVLAGQAGMTPLGVLRLLSTGPAGVMGLGMPRLAEAAGSSGVVLFDPDMRYTLERVGTFSRSVNTPFWRRTLRGRVLGVWRRGPAYWRGCFA